MRAGYVLLILASVVLAACSQASKTAESTDFTGTYNLISIDGQPVPYAPVHEGQQGPEIVSSNLTLNDDGTFSMTMSYTNPSGGSISRDFTGTYTQQGAKFNLKWEGAGQTEVTLKGDTLTLNNEGMLFVYQK